MIPASLSNSKNPSDNGSLAFSNCDVSSVPTVSIACSLDSFERRNGERSSWGEDLSQKCKHLVIAYAPEQFQSALLRNIDYFYNFLRVNLRERVSSSSSSSSNEDEPKNSVDVFPRLKFCLIFSTMLCVVCTFAVLSYFLLITVILKLLVPFFAVFRVVQWILDWERSWSRNLLISWWSILPFMEILILFVRFLAMDKFSLDGVLCRFMYHILLLSTLALAKVHVDHSSCARATKSHNPVDGGQFLSILAYILLTYAIRNFAMEGFTLLPLIVRPLCGHLACLLAIATVYKAAIDCRSPSRRSSVHFCELCTSNSVSARSQANSRLGYDSSTMDAKLNNNVQTDGFPDIDLSRFPGRNPRRVSLPAGSLTPVRVESNLSEARGLIFDMLAQNDLPPHLVSGLKVVNSLLLPSNRLYNFNCTENLPRVLDTPYMGGETFLRSVESVAQRRHSPTIVTWSTTTSATGLPTVEPEPSRARSSSYWRLRHLTIHKEEEDSRIVITPTPSVELNGTSVQLTDGTLFDLVDEDNDPVLLRLKDWSFPIFDFSLKSPDTVLTRVAFAIFRRSNFFRTFKISRRKFLSFFHALENGYWDIPYHNRIHAADVMQATYYLTSNAVNASNSSSNLYVQRNSNSVEENDQENGDKPADIKLSRSSSTYENGVDHDESSEGKIDSLTSILSDLELMAVYTAAAMHDYDHPGRTNAFLVAIEDEKAIFYNDRSVLENHHAAASWQLLTRPENNFIEHLDSAEFKRFRYMIVEAILATDLKRHFEILMDFNGKVSNDSFDWENESDKLLACQICIKMADINSPTKSFSLHREWTSRIVEEFYVQGDEERQRGLPASPYMDRHNPQLAKLQDSFITHLVAPLVRSMNEAGLLPLSPNPTSIPEMLINLERNQKYWKQQLGELGELEEDGDATQALVKEEAEMEIIREQDENGSSDSR